MVFVAHSNTVLLFCAAAFLPLMGGSSIQPNLSKMRGLPLRLRGGGACMCIPHRWREMDGEMLNEYLGQAATLNNIERVRHLVEDMDANVESVGPSGQTPLLRASGAPSPPPQITCKTS
ncbi:hypothetical protein T484DRAFT_2818514 [Baffinella frigidus]|nr:hypothetical protein T484DRAFT_2818514 [Cryptophyta sp. CCMP2293]